MSSSSSIREAAACSNCKQVSRTNPTIFLCKNGHNICGQCKSLTKKCPVAKCKYAKIEPRNEALERLVKEHVEFDCKYKVLNKHIKEECPDRLVTCPEVGCKANMAANALHGHRIHCDFRTVSCNGCSETMKAHLRAYHQKKECPFRLVQCPYPWCSGGPVKLNTIQAHLRTHGNNVNWINQNPASITIGSGLSVSLMDEKHPLVAFHAMGKLFLMHVYCKAGLLHVWVSEDGKSSNKRCTITLEGNGNTMTVNTDVFSMDEERSVITEKDDCIQLCSRGIEPFLETNTVGQTKVKIACNVITSQ